VLGPVAVLAGLAVNHAVAHVYPRLAPGGRLMRGVPVAYLVLAALVLRSGGGFARSYLRSSGLPPSASAKVTAYLEAHVPCYAAVAYLNEHAGRHYRAWDFGCADATYFARGLLIGNAYSTGSWYRVLGAEGATDVLREPDVLHRRLAGLAVRYLLLPTANAADPGAYEVAGRFRLLATVGGVDVFRIAAG
jgi:hypothetical protein